MRSELAALNAITDVVLACRPTAAKAQLLADENHVNRIYTGDSIAVLRSFPAASIDLSFWSPPYFVGKNYEAHLTFQQWQELLRGVIVEHARVMKSGSFMVINISDILCFTDTEMPRYMANNISNKKIAITREDVLAAMKKHPKASRYELAKLFGCSEQTIQRRAEHNNVRGGKYEAGTKVFVVGGLLQGWAESVGLYLYDRRIWHKDPCWANSRWHSNSYRAVDEFEYLYVFWKPGIIDVDRNRLKKNEWAEWGSRGVWNIRSVQRNGRHECEFPEMLAERVIRLFSDPGDVVIDPFVGSGTTTRMAHKLKRKYIGIDRLKKYTKLAESRTRENADSD
ncbi:MAG: site-specific DNA-methyltransferase [Candidatus Methylomirabilis oxygeniifera]|uniref:Methyltransferase n=1 Tax=Methylomirabilis oxygeniifera TaxID=671143 RepID=D5MF64_METO1|nr:MAG: site-specific DNA-methyltransferase [Candidatus Methylomirabilis oxyfera]CBE68393.1 Modification methylase BglI (M.BglI) (N(4)-cytosine-specific methyltransferase BglI) (BglI modification methyltransferase) [Candidatus Methylomirabilis oxyfera]